MRSKAIWLALLAFAFQAQATMVSQSQIENAARVWVSQGGSLGAKLGQAVASTDKISVTNGYSFYAVKMQGGGIVFMSSDTQMEPIIAFTENEEIDLSAASPLRMLLERDIAARAGIIGASEVGKATSVGQVTSGTASTDAERKWTALLMPSAGTALSAKTGSAAPVSVLSDVRVAPLLKSKWNQNKGGGGYCWDYYTPEHIACGCTATAAAQIMRYFEWPKVAMPVASYQCEVNGKTVILSTKGGVYDWDNMPYVLTGIVSDSKREAIGRLTYDIGVTLGTSYSSTSGGAADPNKLGEMFRTFKYANCYMFWDGKSYYTGQGGLHNLSLRKKIIYANLDAGKPVELAIYGYPKAHLNDNAYWSGHAVVGDGYGFKSIDGNETAFVHINMGWSGTDDMWYNIPEIDAANSGAHVGDAGYDFLYMGGAAFNISTEQSGLEILSGRVVDDDGIAVENARVMAIQENSVVKQVTTSETGIYALELPGGQDYEIMTLSADGSAVASLDTVHLSKTVGNQSMVVSSQSNVGNSWGNDMVLSKPTVQVVVGAETNIFTRLDKAVNNAMAMMKANPGVQAKVDVIADTELQESVAINYGRITISAQSDAKVIRNGKASLKVDADAVLILQNVSFAPSASPLVEVATGGSLHVGKGVCFGIPDTLASVVTEDAAGFVVVDELTESFAVDCKSARAVGDVFGYAECDSSVASMVASKIINLHDPNGEIAGVANAEASPVALQWGLVPVPLADAAAYYVVDDGVTTNCFRRLDRLFEIYELADTPGSIMVVKDGTLSRRFDVRHDLSIISQTGAVISNLSQSAGFTVSTGKRMTIEGLGFDGMSGDSLFIVDGGILEIGGGSSIRHFSGSANTKSAAIRVVNGGKVMLGSEVGTVEMTDCVNSRSNQSRGGAIYAEGAGTEVVLRNDVTITGCNSRGLGGGVCLGQAAVVHLSGSLSVIGNTSGDVTATPSDIYCASGAGGIVVDGVIDIGSNVGVRYVGNTWTTEGFAFAKVADNFLDAGLIYDSARAFQCNEQKANVKPMPSQDSRKICWAADNGGIEPVDPSVAHVKVTFADGSGQDYYGSLEDAISILDRDATIEVTRDTEIVSNIVVMHKVVIKSAAGGPYVISRADLCEFIVSESGSLSFADVEIDGGSANGLLIAVDSGTLVLESGSVIRNVTGGTVRSDSAVRIRNGGSFVMRDGAMIVDCNNPYATDYSGNGRGGAVTADGLSTVRIEGGQIVNCSANIGGGVFIGNQSTIEVGGTARIIENSDNDGASANVYVPQFCTLYLISPLTGSIGFTPGPSADRVVFGRVSSDFVGTDSQVANSAHNFVHDQNGDVGLAVRNGGNTLLVWSDGVSGDGKYIDADGVVYSLVSGGDLIEVDVPSVQTGLVYTGMEQNGFIIGHGYDVIGTASATNAGNYSATLKLKPGFVWSDGTQASKTIDWMIAKASYDMTGIVFEDATFSYDGKGHKVEIAGVLPKGVTVEYDPSNIQTNVGIYVITAEFTGDVVNYEPIADMVATLTIIDQPDPPPPDPPATNYPTPIAFKSIERMDDGRWRFVVTNGVKDCWYSIRGTKVLSEQFEVKERKQLDVEGDVTFEIDTGSDVQWFWDAIAEPGEVRE